MRGHASYHLHVTQTLDGRSDGVVHINRTCWAGVGHRTSQTLFSLPLRDFAIDGTTPLEQAVACAEAALSALIELREQATPEAYDHP